MSPCSMLLAAMHSDTAVNKNETQCQYNRTLFNLSSAIQAVNRNKACAHISVRAGLPLDHHARVQLTVVHLLVLIHLLAR